MSPLLRQVLRGFIVSLITLGVTAVLGELVLRVQNANQRNYAIEMWRYAKELKAISSNPAFGHVHLKNRSAELQGIEISLNSLGMRGPEPDLANTEKKRVLLLGDSITLGWGVAETETVRAQLQKLLGQKYQVFNGGVGNYNTTRSVAFFADQWRETLKPQIVVVHYFINDAEELPPSTSNVVMRNSQLAVTLYYLFKGLSEGSRDGSSLVRYYRSVYEPESRGFVEMKRALQQLQEFSEKDHFRVILAVIPDIHRLNNYPFTFIHSMMRDIATDLGWDFVDSLDVLQKFKGLELWTIPGDPHPNNTAHELMAEQIARAIASN